MLCGFRDDQKIDLTQSCQASMCRGRKIWFSGERFGSGVREGDAVMVCCPCSVKPSYPLFFCFPCALSMFKSLHTYLSTALCLLWLICANTTPLISYFVESTITVFKTGRHYFDASCGYIFCGFATSFYTKNMAIVCFS